MGHHYIGTEHLLLGLVRQEDSLAVNVLKGLGLNLNVVRTQTARAILQRQAEETQETRKSQREPADVPAPWTPLSPLRYDLTEMAQEGKLDPLIGRQEELERMIQILGRRTKNNPILIGEPGVGKRAIVKGLAQRMVNGEVPLSLMNRRLLVLDASNFVVSIVYRELVAKRLIKLSEEGASTSSILFINNIHRLVAAAGTPIEVANVLKLAVNRGELQVIGTTTPDRYRQYIDTDAAHEWYIQPIEVKEPSLEDAIEILEGVKFRYEKHHQLLITNEALDVAVHLAVRYIAGGFLPDKAFDLLDEASTLVHMHALSDAGELRDTFLKLRQVKKMKEEALAAQRFEDVLELRYQEVELEAKLLELHANRNEADNQPKVTLEDIAGVVSLRTGVPAARLIDEERARLQGDS
jgi:ATP-dependent Clp protease ATP-binding subunit ClpC